MFIFFLLVWNMTWKGFVLLAQLFFTIMKSFQFDFFGAILRAIEVWPLKGIYLSSPKGKQRRLCSSRGAWSVGGRKLSSSNWRKDWNIISWNKAYSRNPSSPMTPLLKLIRADKLKLSSVQCERPNRSTLACVILCTSRWEVFIL